jgi:hypothetical protein
MQLLDDVKEMTEHWKMKEEALDCTLLRTCFGGGYAPVVNRSDTYKENITQRNNTQCLPASKVVLYKGSLCSPSPLWVITAMATMYVV